MGADTQIGSSEVWDVIIVGAGMGGGAAAHRLTELGHSVLLIEKGRDSYDADPKAIMDNNEPDPEMRLRSGRWPTRIAVTVNGSSSEIWPALGCGIGASTLLYASALSRLEPEDFNPQRTPSGEIVQWPCSYSELEPYYQQAERLLGVRGTVDPRDDHSSYDLLPPPAMGASDRALFQSMRERGLNPYRIHVGIDYKPGCGECGGHVCANFCKRDSRYAMIQPAVASGRLTIMSNAEVEHIEAGERTVEYLRVVREGKTITVRASCYVLAAGGYFTPIILQRSRNEHWPEGVGNHRGLVGRYLMFHTSDHIAFWPRTSGGSDRPGRTIALRDFYALDGERYGEVQSTGMTAGFGNVLYFLHLKFDQSPLRHLRLLRPLLRIPAFVASKLFKEATVLATIVLDYPYPDNRVIHDPGKPSGLSVEYTIHDELDSRTKKLRYSLIERLKGLRGFPLWTGVTLNYGHPCGTCRAGKSPETSVVDPDCRVHGLDNLFVLDSSFMPTSGGANPSLTIAANALRVSEVISTQVHGSTAAGESSASTRAVQRLAEQATDA